MTRIGDGLRIGGRAALLSASMLAGVAAAHAQNVAADVAPEARNDAAASANAAANADADSPLQAIPDAITGFSAAGLEARRIETTGQLLPFVPNALGSNSVGLGSANTYYIRGLGSTETLATFDPAVTTFVDGIALGRQNANAFSFFDVDRIEIRRGPQGVRFGRNTSGGAIDIALGQPGTEIAGYGEVSYGSYDRKTARASLDLPLNPRVGLKLSGYFQDDDGYAYNTTTGERLNDNDGAGARTALRIDLAPDLRWNGSVAYLRASGENILNFACDPRAPADCSRRYATTGLRAQRGNFAPLAIAGAKAEFGLGNIAETVIATSNCEWGGEAATLNIISGHVDLKQRYGIDFADGRGFPSVADPVPAVRGAPLGGFTTLNDGAHRQFSQEVRLSGRLFGGGLDYVTGIYVVDENNKTDFADIATNAAGTPLLLADRILENSTRSLAGYIQGDVHLSTALTLTAGVRYTDEKKTLRIADNRAGCGNTAGVACLDQGNLIAATGAPIPTTQSFRAWTPRVAVSYALRPDLLLFAGAARGFKSGGWNGRARSADTLLPFGAETGWTYEGGVKSEWLDNRLRVNVTAFLLDTKDVQLASDFIAADGTAQFVTGNFADLRNKGIEVEVTAIPIDGLNLFANLGFQDAEYRVDDGTAADRYGVKSVGQQQADCAQQLASGQVPLSPALGGAGNAPDCARGIVTAAGAIARPVRTPRFSVAAGGSYDFKVPTAGIILTPSVDVLYRSDFETGPANATIFTGSTAAFPANPFGGDVVTGSASAGYLLVNAGLAMRTDDDNWTLAVECFNCLDEAYVESSLATTSYLNPPRRWQVRLKRAF